MCDLVLVGVGLVVYVCMIGSLFVGVVVEIVLVEVFGWVVGCLVISLVVMLMCVIVWVGGIWLVIMMFYLVEINWWVVDYVEVCGLVVDLFIVMFVDIVMVGNFYLVEIVVLVICVMVVWLDVDVLWIFCMVI